jgi:hypothetical protein
MEVERGPGPADSSLSRALPHKGVIDFSRLAHRKEKKGIIFTCSAPFRAVSGEWGVAAPDSRLSSIFHRREITFLP